MAINCELFHVITNILHVIQRLVYLLWKFWEGLGHYCYRHVGYTRDTTWTI